MVFFPPAWVPQLTTPIPDSISISEFMLDEKYGRCPHDESKNPFTCGLTGRTFTSSEMVARVEYLARALSHDLDWHPNKGSEWEKVIAIFSLNTLDTIVLSLAVHRLSGIASPANASYSASELEYQLKSSGAKALFTCIPLLQTSLIAAKNVGIPRNKIFILDLPKELSGNGTHLFRTSSDLVVEGIRLPPIERLIWEEGQGARQTAFLCYSSGTSGLPKGVMISHRNVIANIIQIAQFEKPQREKESGRTTKVTLGLLPMSHIYGLVAVAKASIWRGDEVIIMPKFEFELLMKSIQKFKTEILYVVPPIILLFIKNPEKCSKYDLSSVRAIYSGAAPLRVESAKEIQRLFPNWVVQQGYGLTETSTVVSLTSENDVYLGSSGSLLPGVSAKIVSPDGTEITTYDTPGELFVQSPSLVLGYINNEKANQETFVNDTNGQGRWMRTGDEAIVRKSPSGNEHIFITDRIKELIKVKGLQVAPAELESHLLSHPLVSDCAVISIPHESSGEVPKAFVVKSPSAREINDEQVAREITLFVEEHKAKHKWLKGGIKFVDVIPKNPTGKILRKVLREQEKELRRKQGAKM